MPLSVSRAGGIPRPAPAVDVGIAPQGLVFHGGKRPHHLAGGLVQGVDGAPHPGGEAAGGGKHHPVVHEGLYVELAASRRDLGCPDLLAGLGVVGRYQLSPSTVADLDGKDLAPAHRYSRRAIQAATASGGP